MLGSAATAGHQWRIRILHGGLVAWARKLLSGGCGEIMTHTAADDVLQEAFLGAAPVQGS